MRQVLIPTSLARPPAPALAGECLEFCGESMGTSWQVRVYAPASSASTLRAAITEELALVIRQMSHWAPESDLSRFNAAPADTLVVLPDPLFGLLVRARRLAADTGGACDFTVGALVRRWGFGPDRQRLDSGFHVPNTAESDALRQRTGWQHLQLEPGTRRAYQPGGLELDLSAIAKGYAVDLVSRRLSRDGFGSHLVEIGGELRGAGVKPDAQPWWVALEQPDAHAMLDESLVALCDRAIATSGDYRRWYESGSGRIAHTLDPRTGRPAANDLACVTVLSEECWQADAVSTALMVMGAEEGQAFANIHDIAARFVRRTAGGFSESCSRAWSDMLL